MAREQIMTPYGIDRAKKFNRPMRFYSRITRGINNRLLDPFRIGHSLYGDSFVISPIHITSTFISAMARLIPVPLYQPGFLSPYNYS